MQGELDVETGVSMRFPHCEGWCNVPIKELLQNHFHYKVYVEHDPNCMLYSEIYREVTENSILFRIDKSIGMAAYIDGNILRGKGLLEVKNCIIVPEGKECRSGKKGTLEAYVCDCIKNKEYNSDAMEEFIPPFANFIYNMAHIFNANKIILTGELINYKERFEDFLLSEFCKYANKDEIKIIFAEETKKVVYGAALIAAQSAIDEIEV